MTTDKRIAITIPYGMSARNVLRSTAYRLLHDRADVTLFTPLASDAEFVSEFARPRTTIALYPSRIPIPYRGFRLLLDHAEGYWFTRTHHVRTLEILEDALRHEHPWLHRGRLMVGSVFGRSWRRVSALREIQRLFLPTRDALDALRNAHVGVLLLTHPLAIQEFPLAFAARSLGIRTVGLVHSWDNLTAKSGIRTVTSNSAGRMLPIAFDHMIVWNDIMRRELETLYSYSSNQISIIGVPQFDMYNGFQPEDRRTFCEARGLDPSVPIVTYAAGSRALLRDQEGVLRDILMARRDGAFGPHVQILVRGHPGSGLDAFRRTAANEQGVAFDAPSAAFTAVVAKSGWSSDTQDARQLANVLAHSAVCVNVASTLALDCAMLDRPIVCVAYDGRETRPYHQSVRKHYDFTHYLPVVESGGARIAYSANELLTSIRDYLEDPKRDAHGRRNIVRSLCAYDDGNSGYRLARELLSMLKGSTLDHACQSDLPTSVIAYQA